MQVDPRRSIKLTFALGAIYLIWGSSFLFSKIAVTHLPFAMFAGIRFLTAGVSLALIARYWNGDPWPSDGAELRHVTIAGFSMVFASNGLNAWALQYIPTHESALLNSTSAFWIAGLGVYGKRGHPLSRRAFLGLIIGFIGTILMLLPHSHVSPTLMLAKFGVLAACLAWSLGTLYYRSIDTQLSSLMFVGLQMLIGGAMLLGIGLAGGEPAHFTFNLPGLIALLYLTFFSSCLAYSAYAWLALNAAPAVIGTYGYVNPAIAAFLGWQFLDETLARRQIAGMLIIILAVALLTLPGGSLIDRKILAEPKSQ